LKAVEMTLSDPQAFSKERINLTENAIGVLGKLAFY
jgi:hypothetical protein